MVDPWHFHSAVRSMYSWQSVAERTERAYQRAMQVGEGVRPGEWARQNISVSAATRPVLDLTHQPNRTTNPNPGRQPRSLEAASDNHTSICRPPAGRPGRQLGGTAAAVPPVWALVWQDLLLCGGGGLALLLLVGVVAAGTQARARSRLSKPVCGGSGKGGAPPGGGSCCAGKQSDCRELPEANARQVLTESCLATAHNCEVGRCPSGGAGRRGYKGTTSGATAFAAPAGPPMQPATQKVPLTFRHPPVACSVLPCHSCWSSPAYGCNNTCPQ